MASPTEPKTTLVFIRSGTTVVQRTYLELGTYLELSSSVRRSKDAWDPYIKNQHWPTKPLKMSLCQWLWLVDQKIYNKWHHSLILSIIYK